MANEKQPTVAGAKPSPIAAAQAARKNRPAGPREEVHSKEAFVTMFRGALKSKLNVETSNAKTWDIFKIGINCIFELAKTKPVSLSGIGRFAILESQRSKKINKPAKRMRYKASARVTRLLNEGSDFLADLGEDETDTPPAPATKATAPKAAKAAATPAPPTAAKAAGAAGDLI